MAAIYGLMPHEMGFCGPQEKKTSVLLNYVRDGQGKEKELREILSQFKRAYAFYRLIAQKNKIKDPFDIRVVEAYWLGNELLKKVDFASLSQMMLEEFPSILGIAPKAIGKSLSKISKIALPHHSFLVLFSSNRLSDSLDPCLVGWGTVKEIDKKLLVDALCVSHKNGLGLDKSVEKIISWREELLPRLRVGDIISFHWNFACQILTTAQVKNLEKYTRQNLAAFNKRRS